MTEEETVPSVVVPFFVVVVTGSECTGKTTLASDLADRYGTAWAPEYARGYSAAKAAPLDASDVEPIARGQMAAEDAAARAARERGRALVVLDTDLVSTVVYAHHYYGSCPAWIEDEARARKGHLYLLLHPDVPWLPDGVRDRPRRREHMHRLFRETLADMGARTVDVRGSWEERRCQATTVVDAAAGVTAPRD